MKHDFNRILRVVGLMPFAPIVTNRIGKYRSVSVKGGSGNRPIDGGESFEAVFRVLVPI